MQSLVMLDEFRLKLYLTDEVIFKHYIPDLCVNQAVLSPLRKEGVPSFVVHYKGGKHFWKDYGNVSDIPNDSIGFVQAKFELDREQAIEKIWSDIVINKDVTFKASQSKKPKGSSIGNMYDCYTHSLNKYELKYWSGKLLIPKQLLDQYKVFGLEGLYRKNDLIWRSTPDSPAFVYLFDGTRSFKVYRPFDNKKDKFRGQNNGHVIEGWDQLPKSAEELIIQSSYKDTIVCRNAGYFGCNPSGESSLTNLLSKAAELNTRFGKIFVLFDNDPPGRKASAFLCGKTGWEPIFMESFKDPSDSVYVSNSYDILYKEVGKYLKIKNNI